MPLTELILTENVPGLGAEADVVKVRRGYARNYLLPRGKAYEVTSGALRKLDALKQKRAEREARELNEAQELARRIGKARFIFTLETGGTGKAFGSVTAQDIMNRIKNELGAEIDRHKIVLERPIKDTGEHEITKKLFPFRPQVLRRIFTVPRRIASRQNRASWGQCCSRRGKPLPNASRKLMSNIFTSLLIRRSTLCSSIFGMPGRR